MSEEYVMYLLVRKDLKMGKGKIAAQCGHAVQELIEKCPLDVKRKYYKTGCAKIVLQIGSEDELMEKCQEVRKKTFLYSLVVDAGKTQIESGSKTVLGIGPVKKDEIHQIVGDLKLL